jgi:hypothetical protein
MVSVYVCTYVCMYTTEVGKIHLDLGAFRNTVLWRFEFFIWTFRPFGSSSAVPNPNGFSQPQLETLQSEIPTRCMFTLINGHEYIQPPRNKDTYLLQFPSTATITSLQELRTCLLPPCTPLLQPPPTCPLLVFMGYKCPYFTATYVPAHCIICLH